MFIGYWLGILLAAVLVSAFLPPESAAFLIVAFLGVLGAPVISFFLVRQKRRALIFKLSDSRIEEANAIAAQQRRKFVERERLLEAVRNHQAAIRRNLERAYQANDYGAVVKDGRDEAFEEFFASIALDRGAIPFGEAKELVFEELGLQKEKHLAKQFDPNDIPFDGAAFEKWVAESLKRFGWDAEVTKGSGDQGIDVIARKNGISVGIQCKLYSSSIGNAAIQQAHSGAKYHSTQYAAVLSNSSFTQSAKDLAAVTGVKLMSQHDIPQLEALLLGE